jgi:hypothetical protein|tara:strand:+ start:2768 stop:3304 length:537 start_codon:yes stop_codon:yes gene_type:complete
MKLLLSFGIATASVFVTVTNASAQDAINSVAIQQVAHSTVINKSCNQVWPLITDFGGIASWYTGFSESSQIAGPINQVGAIRKLVRASNGKSFQEKMVYLDSSGYTLAYSHIKNGPVRETINQVRLSDLNNQSQCLATWGSTFRLKPEQANDAEKIRGFFIAAFKKVILDLKSQAESI